ncbi:response regulator [Spirosoma panaciterrae]|uniref:response regulator n=1 Tax=Spirosoma panaciterrae TaxID=496058 RepID=UPI000378CDC1
MTVTSLTENTPEKVVYLVDDDEEDAALFEMTMHQFIPNCRLRIFYNGLILLEVLREPAAKPDLIFLDLYMPYPDGIEILLQLKINKALAGIPVIILTGVDDTEKVSLAYQLGAQSVINKPYTHSQLVDMVISIREYWFKTVRLPDQA